MIQRFIPPDEVCRMLGVDPEAVAAAFAGTVAAALFIWLAFWALEPDHDEKYPNDSGWGW